MNTRAIEPIKARPLSKPAPRPLRSSLLFAVEWALPIVIVFLIVAGGITVYLEKWLWMGQLHYDGVFWTLLAIQWGMFIATFAVVFLFLWMNLRLALRGSGVLIGALPAGTKTAVPTSLPPGSDTDEGIAVELSPKLIRSAVLVFSLLIAWSSAQIFFSEWDTFLRFRYGGSFGINDPLFGMDVGFYVFRLPFYRLLQTSVVLVTAMTIICVSTIRYAPRFWGRTAATTPATAAAPATEALSHLSGLLLILVAAWGFGFMLDHYSLVYSNLGVVYGAGFAAAHVTQAALWVMVAASALACVFLAFNAFRPHWRPLLIGAATYVGLYSVGVLFLPVVFQQLAVVPSELERETPYLKSYIDFTRKAYDLDRIQEVSYPALSDLTPAVLARNQDTVENIRLWDQRPLLQMYQQTQAIRLYYQFYNVAVDRYHLSDGYHQVMLATRELSPELPAAAQTWVNQYLQFTHGSGLVMNSVSQKIGGGFPAYLLENVPATSTAGLSIAQPAIYYGQSMTGYRIVATGTKEFDYPKGNDNVYTSYAGTGGVPIDSFWRRMLFALTQKDLNILLTTYIQPKSRIQIWRDVQQRVSKIAPFLRLDSDPYPVLSQGKLYWIQDAYTTSGSFEFRVGYVA